MGALGFEPRTAEVYYVYTVHSVGIQMGVPGFEPGTDRV